MYRRALAFQSLGYRTAVLRDRDKEPDAAEVRRFEEAGGPTFAWRPGNAIEDELFHALSEPAVGQLLEAAARVRDREQVNSLIGSVSKGSLGLNDVEVDLLLGNLDPQKRAVLGKAARHGAWFKSIGDMQDVALRVVGPGPATADPEFGRVVEDIFEWLAGE